MRMRVGPSVAVKLSPYTEELENKVLYNNILPIV